MDPFSTTVISSVIAELAKTVVTETARKVGTLWGASEVALEKDLEKSFTNYLSNAYKKNANIKTLIYKNVSKPLKSFYEPLNVKFNNISYSTLNIETLFNTLGNHFIVTGTGGMGKSTMMRYLYLNCIEEKYALPIIIELRDFDKRFKTNPQIKFSDYLYEYMNLYKFNANEKLFIHTLHSGKLVLLLDGFDELDYTTSAYLENEIKEFALKYDECKIIVSSRPSNEFQNWHNFIEVTMCELSKNQSISLIQKIDLDDPNLKELFISVLESELYDKYTEFASIPLLLTIMLITYKENASIPENLHDFYDKAFNTLFYQHDAQKGVYKRELKCNLNREEFKDILVFFSFNTYFKSDYSFTEEEVIKYIASALKTVNQDKVDPINYLRDLEKSVCILIKDGQNYQFIHRSFQEYFAALFVMKQNDDIQCKIINKLLVDHYFLFDRENTFLNTFKLSQPSRYIKNVIYNLSTPYKDLSLQEMYLQLMSGIRFEHMDNDKTDNLPDLIISINNANLYFTYCEYESIVLGISFNIENRNKARLKLIEKFNIGQDDSVDFQFNEIDNDTLDGIIEILEISLNIRQFINWLKIYSQNQQNNDLNTILGLF